MTGKEILGCPDVKEMLQFPFSIARRGEMTCTGLEYNPDEGLARAKYQQGDLEYQLILMTRGKSHISVEQFTSPTGRLTIASQGITVEEGEDYYEDVNRLRALHPHSFRVSSKRLHIPLFHRPGLYYVSEGIEHTEGLPVVINEKIVSYKALVPFNGVTEYTEKIYYEGQARLNSF